MVNKNKFKFFINLILDIDVKNIMKTLSILLIISLVAPFLQFIFRIILTILNDINNRENLSKLVFWVSIYVFIQISNFIVENYRTIVYRLAEARIVYNIQSKIIEKIRLLDKQTLDSPCFQTLYSYLVSHINTEPVQMVISAFNLLSMSLSLIFYLAMLLFSNILGYFQLLV